MSFLILSVILAGAASKHANSKLTIFYLANYFFNYFRSCVSVSSKYMKYNYL